MEGRGRSWKVMEGHGRSRKVKEGHGWSFPITGLTFQVRKVFDGCQPQSKSLSCGLWIRDSGLVFWTWILDLDLGHGFGTGLGLDKNYFLLVLGRDEGACD